MGVLRPYCELLYAVIVCDCNVNAAVGCHRYAVRVPKLPVSRPRCATPFYNEHTVGGELLDAVVTII